MDAIQEYQSGKLNEAVQAATEAVKSAPQDMGKRRLLCELLCFAGEFAHIDTHLDLIAAQDLKAKAVTALFRQLLRAEQSRQEFHTKGRVPEFLSPPGEEIQLRLRASIDLREGNNSQAVSLLADAEKQRPKLTGTCDGKPFDDMRDLDELCASVFEVLTSTGKYYWVPMATVKSLEIRPVARLRDLIWRPARMVVRDGPDGEVFLAALYAGSRASADPRLRLGRATDWIGQPPRGVGQREFLIGEGSAAISDITQIEFADQVGS